ncbi:MAG: PIN domain-containing protein [Chloroflexota bacterium]
MIPPVFLDTSGLYEAGDRRAPMHDRARDQLRALLSHPGGLLTTEVVIVETHALVLRRAGPTAALATVDRLVSSPRIEIVPVDGRLRRAATELLGSRPQRLYSLADALSFQVMRDRGITQAFTLDADFAAEGFEVLLDPG